MDSAIKINKRVKRLKLNRPLKYTCNAVIDPLTGDACEDQTDGYAKQRCEYKLSDSDLFCPMCGYPNKRRKAPESKIASKKRVFGKALTRVGNYLNKIGNNDGDMSSYSTSGDLGLNGDKRGDRTIVIREGGNYVSSVISTVIGLFAAVWGWGAFNAYRDVEDKKPLLVVMAKAYGSTYNPITRHGYRMYIKHFTTMEGVEDKRKESDRYKAAIEETVYDLKNGLGL